VACLESPNVVDIHGGHLQAAGGNIAHGKVLFTSKKKDAAGTMEISFGK
jgi:hypothetical protein